MTRPHIPTVPSLSPPSTNKCSHTQCDAAIRVMLCQRNTESRHQEVIHLCRLAPSSASGPHLPQVCWILGGASQVFLIPLQEPLHPSRTCCIFISLRQPNKLKQSSLHHESRICPVSYPSSSPASFFLFDPPFSSSFFLLLSSAPSIKNFLLLCLLPFQPPSPSTADGGLLCFCLNLEELA